MEGSFGARSHDLPASATTVVVICHVVNTVFACPSRRLKLSSLQGLQKDPVGLIYISLSAVPSGLLLPLLLTLLTDPAAPGRDSTSAAPGPQEAPGSPVAPGLGGPVLPQAQLCCAGGSCCSVWGPSPVAHQPSYRSALLCLQQCVQLLSMPVYSHVCQLPPSAQLFLLPFYTLNQRTLSQICKIPNLCYSQRQILFFTKLLNTRFVLLLLLAHVRMENVSL